jgi:hypothetical protein
VHEAKVDTAVSLVGHLKRANRERKAERTLDDTGCLPEPLRTLAVDVRALTVRLDAIAPDEDANRRLVVQAAP